MSSWWAVLVQNRCFPRPAWEARGCKFRKVDSETLTLTSALISISRFLSNVSDAGVARIADGCRGLTAINLTYCKNVAGVGLERIASRCSKLTDITFVYCGSVGDAGLESIAKVSFIYLFLCTCTGA